MKKIKYLIVSLPLLFISCLSGCDKTERNIEPSTKTEETVYVESISLKAEDEEHVQSRYNSETETYIFATYYEDNLVVEFKVEVLPANATNKKVSVSYDSDYCAGRATFGVPDDNGYFDISVLEGGFGAIDFDVVSTDGKDLKVHAKLLVL